MLMNLRIVPNSRTWVGLCKHPVLNAGRINSEESAVDVHQYCMIFIISWRRTWCRVFRKGSCSEGRLNLLQWGNLPLVQARHLSCFKSRNRADQHKNVDKGKWAWLSHAEWRRVNWWKRNWGASGSIGYTEIALGVDPCGGVCVYL